MNYIKIILENTASNGLSGSIVEGFDSFKRYNRGKNLVKVELKNFELDPGERLEVGFVQCDESGNVSEDLETALFSPSLMSTTDDPKTYVAKVPDGLFMTDAEYYNIEIRRVCYADVDTVDDKLEVDTSDSAIVGPVAVSARSLARDGTEPNVGDFVAIEDKVDALEESLESLEESVTTNLRNGTGEGSVTAGLHTEAGYANQFVIGTYNDNKAENIFEVGGGTSDDDRKNAFEVRKDGTVYAGGKKLSTADEVKDEVKALEKSIDAVEEATADIEEIRYLAKHANVAFVYDNYRNLINRINASLGLSVGFNLYVKTLEVPDLWISAVYDEAVDCTYVSDALVVNTLKNQGYIRVGYYDLSPLETGKVDLTEYVKTEKFNALEEAVEDHESWLQGLGDFAVQNSSRIKSVEDATADIEEIRSLAKGSQLAFAVNGYQELIGILNNESNEFNIGQNIYVRTLNVPDVWIARKANEYIEYVYQGDDALIEALKNHSLQIGYWLISPLETGKVDLTDYVKVTDYATADKAGVAKANGTYGVKILSNGFLCVNPADKDNIKSKVAPYKPITTTELDYAVKIGITTNTETLTDEEKTSACEWLGVDEKIAEVSGGTQFYMHEMLFVNSGLPLKVVSTRATAYTDWYQLFTDCLDGFIPYMLVEKWKYTRIRQDIDYDLDAYVYYLTDNNADSGGMYLSEYTIADYTPTKL